MDIENGTEYIYRSMADGCTEILFHYKGSFQEVTSGGRTPQPVAQLHAQSQIHKRYITSESFGIFGAYLYPYVIPYLFNLPAYETIDQNMDIKLLAGNETRVLEDQMMLALDNKERVEIFSAYLHKKLAHVQTDTGFTSCIHTVLNATEFLTVSELSEHANLSTRQLQRKFRDYIGFNPKLFTRIVRFQSSLKNYKPKSTLTDIAYSCGYYDQSHFIHDFRQFSGYHPKQYFFGQPEGIEWREV